MQIFPWWYYAWFSKEIASEESEASTKVDEIVDRADGIEDIDL